MASDSRRAKLVAEIAELQTRQTKSIAPRRFAAGRMNKRSHTTNELTVSKVYYAKRNP